MTADNFNTPEMTGQEIIAKLDDDAQAQGLEDPAELPFGNDNAEDEEHRSSNQTSGLFNRRTILVGVTILFVCAAVGLSSAALTSSNNNNMVVESFNAFARDASPTSGPTSAPKSTKGPTAKSGKSSGSGCHPNDNTAPPGGDCKLCCDDCSPYCQTCSFSGTPICQCGP